jgi:hypothetical protein
MKIKATFRGRKDSRGFETGKEYELEVLKNPFSATTALKTKDGLSCAYGSAAAFLISWDNIKIID